MSIALSELYKAISRLFNKAQTSANVAGFILGDLYLFNCKLDVCMCMLARQRKLCVEYEFAPCRSNLCRV